MKYWVLVGVILLLTSFSSADLRSSISSSCSNSEPLISISNPNSTTSHPAEPGYYSNDICVSGIENAEIGSSCDKTTGFYISGREDNAHVSNVQNYNLHVCTGRMKVDFDQSCTENETKLFSISSKNNGHVAGPGIFDIKGCGSFSSPENVSIITRFNLSSSDSVTFDEEKVSGEKTFYPPAELPYIVSKSGEQLGGIVTSSFLKASRKVEDKNRLKVVKDESSGAFIIPFTEASIADIEDKEDEIPSGEFSDLTESSFGYPEFRQPIIKLRLTPESDINSDIDLSPGSYSLKIEKTGKNTLNISVR